MKEFSIHIETMENFGFLMKYLMKEKISYQDINSTDALKLYNLLGSVFFDQFVNFKIFYIFRNILS